MKKKAPVRNDTPPDGAPLPYDFRLGLKVAAAGLAAAFLFSGVARIFTTSLRNNETLVFAWVLGLMLAGVYTWLAARQPDAVKFVPPAIVGVLAIFVPGDLSEARGNVESMERFWNTLPAYGAILGTSGMVGFLVWMPVLRKWAGGRRSELGASAALPPRKNTSSGPVKKKTATQVPKAVSKPPPSRPPPSKPPPSKPPPRPEPSPQPEFPVDLEDEQTAPNPVEEPKVRRTAITTELPKIRKK
jgi:hypothetical protein